MCDPISGGLTAGQIMAANIGLSMISTMMNYATQQQAASAQAAYINQANNAAIDSYYRESMVQNLRIQEEQEATSEDLQNLMIERKQKMGEYIASSQSAGLSFSNVLADYMRQEAQYKDAANRNLELKERQSQLNIEGMRAQTNSRINSNMSTALPQPSLFAAGLDIAGSTLSAYTTFSTPKYNDKNQKVYRII